MSKRVFTIENRIAQIKMDDGKANGIDFSFFEDINKGLDKALDKEAGVVLFTGRDGFFSAGLNLKFVMALNSDDFKKFNIEFAETMLRIFTFPIPTIAACTGHTIAGGAMLAFACDKRFIIKGDYKIQMNETLIGIPVPEWMLLISKFAIPGYLQTEALLHAKMYNPESAVENGIFNGFINDKEDICGSLKPVTDELLFINSDAYKVTKESMRNEKISFVMEKLQIQLSEMVSS